MPTTIERIESQPFAENSYLVYPETGSGCIMIDPGFEPQLLLTAIGRSGRTLEAIVLTHGHVDHIAGNRALKKSYPDAAIIIGTIDAPMLTDPNLNLSGQFGMPLTSPPADRLVSHGDVVEVAGLTLEVRHVPGHSPGHVVYWLAAANALLGGDVLFAGSVGRADFPGGDLELLLSGIRAQVLTLPADAAVHPGHGPATTVGREARANPYLRGE